MDKTKKSFIFSGILFLHLLVPGSLVTSFKTNCNNVSNVAIPAGIGLGAAGALAASIVGVVNYAELRTIQMKGRTDHLLFGDDENRGTTQFRNWRRDEWPSAGDIQKNRQLVVTALSSAIINHEFIVTDDWGAVIDQPTWGDVSRAILREKQEIRADLEFLEKKHVSYFSFWPALFDAYGLLKDYKAACLAEGIDPYGVASWTKEQENRMEARMKQLCQCKWWHFPFKINYGKATRIYWREFKLWKRLDMLRKLIADMNADNVHVQEAPPPYHVVLEQR